MTAKVRRFEDRRGISAGIGVGYRGPSPSSEPGFCCPTSGFYSGLNSGSVRARHSGPNLHKTGALLQQVFPSPPRGLRDGGSSYPGFRRASPWAIVPCPFGASMPWALAAIRCSPEARRSAATRARPRRNMMTRRSGLVRGQEFGLLSRECPTSRGRVQPVPVTISEGYQDQPWRQRLQHSIRSPAGARDSSPGRAALG